MFSCGDISMYFNHQLFCVHIQGEGQSSLLGCWESSPTLPQLFSYSEEEERLAQLYGGSQDHQVHPVLAQSIAHSIATVFQQSTVQQTQHIHDSGTISGINYYLFLWFDTKWQGFNYFLCNWLIEREFVCVFCFASKCTGLMSFYFWFSQEIKTSFFF